MVHQSDVYRCVVASIMLSVAPAYDKLGADNISAESLAVRAHVYRSWCICTICLVEHRCDLRLDYRSRRVTLDGIGWLVCGDWPIFRGIFHVNSAGRSRTVDVCAAVSAAGHPLCVVAEPVG